MDALEILEKECEEARGMGLCPPYGELIAMIKQMRADHHEHINRAQITVSTAELRAMKAEEKLTKARVGAARYVNAMGRHITDSWREHFIDSCELSVDSGNPHFPLVAHKLEKIS